MGGESDYSGSQARGHTGPASSNFPDEEKSAFLEPRQEWMPHIWKAGPSKTCAEGAFSRGEITRPFPPWGCPLRTRRQEAPVPNVLTFSLLLRSELSDTAEILTSRTHSRLWPSPSCSSDDLPGRCRQEQPTVTHLSQEGKSWQ